MMPAVSLRYEVRVNGIVQGVGFRPFVYRLANALGLKGIVRNTGSHLSIDVEGDKISLEAFVKRLRNDHPPLARIAELTVRSMPYLGYREFVIEESVPLPSGRDKVYISPDLAICPECRRELLDSSDRRFRYPLINCTNCGPRFSIITGVPYDREKTTMQVFPLCHDCAGEYNDPANRRYHAEPIACPACGPHISFIRADGYIEPADGGEVLSRARDALLHGKILAVKGLGGYHLACNALDSTAVKELRRRKSRDEKPFAVMAANLEVIVRYCDVGGFDEAILRSPASPILLLPKRADSELPEDIAPNNPSLGVMLPYTPLHVLLFEGGGPELLVMTSGNIGGEPICYKDDEALTRLKGIADAFLVHDREIHTRVDDSVVRVIQGQESFIRRSRGYAPMPITVRNTSETSVLACGGQLKNTFCLNRGSEFYLSHHIGDLENLETLEAFEKGVDLFKQNLAVSPEAVVHDLHPNYLSTQYALSQTLPRIGVQHHRAHIASCIADNQLEGEVIGVAFDGAGYGDDGRIWGGEFFVGDLNSLERIGHLEYVRIPGGDSAVAEPWKTACGYLAHAYGSEIEFPEVLPEVLSEKLKIVASMLANNMNVYETSSAGRLFDAAAALCGVRSAVSYEGQAAIELEYVGSRSAQDVRSYPFTLDMSGAQFIVRTDSIIKGLISDKQVRKDIAATAGSFHETVARIILDGCICSRVISGISRVVLSGGVFQNNILTRRALSLLQSAGFSVYLHRHIPANDGGLALGQAVLALATMS